MENLKFQICAGKDAQFYFRLRARNGETVLASEVYEQKGLCFIESAKQNSPIEESYERQADKRTYFFLLKASNGAIIGKSDNYTDAVDMENWIQVVKMDSPTADIEDLT